MWTFSVVPIKRLIELTVSGFVTAWRFAGPPTITSPLALKDTTEGTVFLPSGDGITLTVPSACKYDTTEFVVPKSIPIIVSFAIIISPFYIKHPFWRFFH